MSKGVKSKSGREDMKRSFIPCYCLFVSGKMSYDCTFHRVINYVDNRSRHTLKVSRDGRCCTYSYANSNLNYYRF